MRMTVLQPCYFPSLGVLSRVAMSDVIIWADSFQYSKHGTINRTRIKTASGASWLTISVLTKGGKGRQIRYMAVDRQHHWPQSHLKSLEVSYQNSPYFYFFTEELERLLHADCDKLNDLLLASTRFLFNKIRLGARLITSDQLPSIKDRSQKVVSWMRECGCDEYIVEKKDLAFIDSNTIFSAGVKISEFDYIETEYHQLFHSFISNLSGLDLLFNEGEMSRLILKNSAAIKKREEQ